MTFLNVDAWNSLLYLLFIARGEHSYDEAHARLFANYARVSLCADEKIHTWACGDICDAAPVVNGSQRLLGPDPVYKVRGYVARVLNTDEVAADCVVAFAGTSFYDLANIASDVESWLEPWPMWTSPSGRCASTTWCQDCEVMHGYALAYTDLRETMMTFLNELKCQSVAFTGHSLGGGLAALASMELRACGEKSPGIEVTGVWTFGMPRIGNLPFALEYTRIANASGDDPPMWRIVHDRDRIPRVPFVSSGYRHVPLEIYYTDQNSSLYEVCPSVAAPQLENPQCMWATPFLRTTMQEHNNYFPNFTFDENLQPQTCIPPYDIIAKKNILVEQFIMGFVVFALAISVCVILCCLARCIRNRTAKADFSELESDSASEVSEEEEQE